MLTKEKVFGMEVEKRFLTAIEREKGVCEEYYSIIAYLDDGDDFDEFYVKSLLELYELWRKMKKEYKPFTGIKWKFKFFRHRISLKCVQMYNILVFKDACMEGAIKKYKGNYRFKETGATEDISDVAMLVSTKEFARG